MHHHEDHVGWNESVRFDFHDRAMDVCGFLGIGIWPRAAVKEVTCYLMMPDGSTVALRDFVPLDAPTLAAKGFRFDVLEPEKRWKVAFLGGMERTTERKAKKSHVEMNLEFEAFNEAFDHGSCDRPANVSGTSRDDGARVEQFGRLRGRLSTGLDDFEIDALGDKVHSWGVTDPDGMTVRTALSCQFSETHGISLLRRVAGEGPTDTGYVFQDGRNIPFVGTVLNVNSDFDKSPKSFDMTLQDAEGGTHKVFGSVVRKVKVHFKSPDGELRGVANETLARYTVAGKNGYGISEFLTATE